MADVLGPNAVPSEESRLERQHRRQAVHRAGQALAASGRQAQSCGAM
jgi:hypothetical protein